MYKISYVLNNKNHILYTDTAIQAGKELYNLKKDHSCTSYNVVNTCIMKIVDSWTRPVKPLINKGV